MKNKMGKKNNSSIILLLVLIILGMGGYYYYTKYKETAIPTYYDQYTVLSDSLTANGYKCENLLQSGNSCIKKNEKNEYKFFRFDDGFQYMITSVNYRVNVVYRDASNEISFQTYKGAFEGYKDKKYFCSTNTNDVLGHLEVCLTQDKEQLDSEVYLNVVRNALYDIDNILQNSGFDTVKLIENFKWEK